MEAGFKAMKVAIGIVYERIRLDAKRTNIKRLEDGMNKLLKRYDNVKLVILPAYPFTGPLSAYDPLKLKRVVWSNAERITAPTGRSRHSSVIATMLRWSMEYGVYIVGGPILERAGPKVYLTIVSTSPNGDIIGRYRKISLTKLEEEAGISSGRLPGLMRIGELGLTLGVFVEDDLAYPELFRAMQVGGANIVLGFTLPYQSTFFGDMVQVDKSIVSMNMDILASFLVTRSKETGLPLILVGGAVEVSGAREKLYLMPIIPVEPDVGVVRDKIKGVNDIGSSILIEVDTSISKPRILGNIDRMAMKLSCKAIEQEDETST